MKRMIAVLVALVLAVGGAGRLANAATILSNGVDPPYLGDGTIFNDQMTIKAVGLEMQDGQDYTFDSFRVVLERTSLSPEATGHIFSHDGTNTPAAELQTLNTVTVESGTNVYDFTSPVPFTLEDDTSYWFAISDGPSDGWFRWDQTDPPVTPTGGPGSYLGYVMSVNSGSSWFTSSVRCAFEINGTVVPEPQTIVLLSTGVLGLLAYVWRRRNAGGF